VREIAIDTETTGLEVKAIHRVVELGCIELRDRFPTGRVWHSYFNPECAVPQEAVAIHGLTEIFLAAAPRFADRAADFLEFVSDGILVAHNALFDQAFLNAELFRCGLKPLTFGVDTLELARRKLPGRHHAPDALCDYFGVSRTHRDKHGALLDAQLLAEIYSPHTCPELTQLSMDFAPMAQEKTGGIAELRRQRPLPACLSKEEAAAHAAFIRSLGAPPLWDLYELAPENARGKSRRL
jgi:DNA polymerase-3 subunit epsilon